MPRIPGLRRIVRLDAPARRVERDVDDELAFHFDAAVAELVAAGHSPERARAEAERRFGDVPRYRAELASIARGRAAVARRADLAEAVAHDLRHALRGLRRQPGFTLAVVLTLALGIGANATMFGLVDRMLLRPPAHVAAPERLRAVGMRYVHERDTIDNTALSYPLLRDLRAGATGLAPIAAYARSGASLGRGAEACEVRTMIVSGDYFALLGVRPLRGRLLGPADDAAGSPPAAVVSHGFWRRHFGGAADAVGRTLELDRARYTVVGIAPEGFAGLGRTPPDVWLPLVPNRLATGNAEALAEYGWQWLTVVGRLDDAAGEARAAARASRVLRAPADPAAADSTMTATLRSVLPRAAVRESANARVALLLAGVSTLLLLIACANVANLLLARALRRRREIAVRLALGVSRARLVGQLLAESVLLALLGGAAALLVAHWGGTLVQRLLVPDAAWSGSPVDARVLAFTALAALATGVLAGLLPALQASRPALAGALRAGAREGGGRQSRTRAALLVTQAALSVVLLVGTGLFVRSLRQVGAERLGMDVDAVLVGSMRLSSLGYDAARTDALFRDIVERVRALPQVRSAALTNSLPFYSYSATTFRLPGRDSLPTVPDRGPYVSAVSPDYHATMGTRILRGRPFGAADRAGSAPVAIVNAAMAELYWPGEDPIGQCVLIGEGATTCTTVVGVAENTRRQGIVEGTSLQYAVPLGQEPASIRSRLLVARPAEGSDPARVAEAVRRAMQGAAADLPFADVHPMRDLLADELRPWRLGAALFGAFGALALALAAVGLYGVIAFSVSQRRHELGVRLALGASVGDVRRLVVRQGVALAAAGVAAGLLLAALAAPRVADLLYRTAPRDPQVFGGVALALLLVAVAASAVPAWRASRVDPATALRVE